MNPYKYTLAAALGAAVASLVTYRIVDHPPVSRSVSAPLPGTRPLATARTTPAPDLAAAERERLAQENRKLKAQLETAHADLITQDTALQQTKAELEDLRRPLVADILSSTLRAELKSGEVVVTGGYALPDGRRLYAFAKPIVQDGNSTVRIEGRYLTLTDEVGKSVGLDNLATNAANTLQHGEVWVPAEEESVLAKLQGTPGTEMLTSPDISVQPGHSGTITIGDIHLRVTPTFAEKGDGLGLELHLEQPQQNAATAAK